MYDRHDRKCITGITCTGGCREVIPLTPSHTLEKTYHLYCTFGGCRRQRHPFQLGASDPPRFTLLPARAWRLQRTRSRTIAQCMQSLTTRLHLPPNLRLHLHRAKKTWPDILWRHMTNLTTKEQPQNLGRLQPARCSSRWPQPRAPTPREPSLLKLQQSHTTLRAS